MGEILSILTVIGVLVSITASAIASYLTVRKSRNENSNLQSQSDKNKAEIVAIYSEELRILKEERKKELEETKNKFLEYDIKIQELSDRIVLLTNSRKEAQKMYDEFISELFVGITKLTGQIQITGQTPIWSPPFRTPFEDC